MGKLRFIEVCLKIARKFSFHDFLIKPKTTEKFFLDRADKIFALKIFRKREETKFQLQWTQASKRVENVSREENVPRSRKKFLNLAQDKTDSTENYW